MTITNLTLINFVNNFGVLDDLKGFDFVLALNRHHDKILSVVEALSKVIEPSKKIKEFQQKGAELYKKYAEKDDTGSPKMVNVGQDRSEYVLEDVTKAEFTKEYEVLRAAYKTEIDAQEANNITYRERLNEPAKALKLTQFSKGELPKGLSVAQMKLLFSVNLVK